MLAHSTSAATCLLWTTSHAGALLLQLPLLRLQLTQRAAAAAAAYV
jgi:hypothetical protein